MADRTGQQLGNYRLLRLLGRGAFAEVYLGEHVSLQTRAAIKVLLVSMTDDNVERFLTEARTVANLQHEHIVRVFDFDVKDDVPFLVMDYAPNGTLRSRHPGGTPLPPTVILPYVKQVAAALQYAHDHKLVHCDVKPQNMLLGPVDKVWLSDFGLTVIARATSSLVSQDMMRGSPAYMAPEQFELKPRPASDQYALGICVYEWLCGSLPFGGPTVGRFYVQHTENPPPPMREHVPEISPAVEKVVQQALAKDYHQRFANVQDFADALEAACRLEPYLLPPSVFNLVPPAPVEPLSPMPPMVPVSTRATPLVAPPVIVAGSATPTRSPDRRKRSIPRRTVMGGLVALALIAAGGIGALTLNRLSVGRPSSANNRQTTPASAPTPVPESRGYTYPAYHGHTSPLTAVAWSPSTVVNLKNRIVSASTNGQVWVWDAFKGGNAVPYKGHTGEVKTVAWSPDGKHVASGGADKTVRIWDPVTQAEEPHSPFRGHTRTVRSVSWSPDGKHIVSGSDDKYVQIWEVASGTMIRQTLYSQTGPNENGVWAVAWSPNGRYIAFGGADKSPPIGVWDVFNVAQPFYSSYQRHKNNVRSLVWSPDSRYIASGSDDNTVQVWEATTGTHHFTYTRHTQAVHSIAWSLDGRYIASGSKDKTVCICDATSGQHIYTYSEAHDEVWAVAWSPNSEYIVSGSSDTIVRVWQAQ